MIYDIEKRAPNYVRPMVLLAAGVYGKFSLV